MHRAIRLSLLAGAVALIAGELALAAPGRVVRIERPTRRAGKPIHVCHFTMSRTQMTCISGGDIQVGEVVSVLAEDGSFERVEVTGIKPSRLDTCRLGHAVDVDLKIVETVGASKSGSPRHTTRFAIRGIEATPGVSKLLSNNGSVRSPSGKPDENVFMTADVDGDSKPDLVASLHNRCDEIKKSPGRVPAGKVVTSWCIDYWRKSDSDQWTKASTEFVHFCQ